MSQESSVAAVVRDVWCEVLNQPDVRDDDNFFMLGGDSFSASAIVARLRERTRANIQVENVFAATDFSAFVRAVEEADPVGVSGVPELKRVDRARPVLASLTQEWQFLLAQDPSQVEKPTFTVSMCHLVRGSLDVSMLRSAFRLVFERHEALRTGFYQLGDSVYQRVFGTEVFDLREIEMEGASRETLDRALHEEVVRPFDRTSPPLVRCSLFRLSEDEHVILIVADHIICDGASLSLLLGDVSAIYNGLLVNSEFHFPQLSYHFMDWSERQRGLISGDYLSGLVDYWSEILGEGPKSVSTSFYDYTYSTSKHAEKVVREIDSDTLKAVKGVARRKRETLYSVLLAAFVHSLFSRVSGDRIMINSTLGNRGLAEVEKVFGAFSHDVYIPVERFHDEGQESFVERVQRALEKSIEYGAIPNTTLWEILWPGTSLSLVDEPIFYFNLNPSEGQGLQINGAQVEQVEIEPTLPMPGLECSADDVGGTLFLEVRYLSGSFSNGYVVAFLDDVSTFLDEYVGTTL